MNKIHNQGKTGTCAMFAIINGIEFLTNKAVDQQEVYDLYEEYDTDGREGLRTKEVLQILKDNKKIKTFFPVYNKFWNNGKYKILKRLAWWRIFRLLKTKKYGLVLGLNIRKGKPKIKLDKDFYILPSDKKISDVHALCVVGGAGYELTLENSWGNWGDEGFCYMDKETFESECWDVYAFTV